jgi:hypothetical protein
MIKANEVRKKRGWNMAVPMNMGGYYAEAGGLSPGPSFGLTRQLHPFLVEDR